MRDDSQYDTPNNADTPSYLHAAERALIGAILLEPQRAQHLRTHLEGSDFDQARNEAVWNTIYKVLDRGVLPDAIAVADQIVRDQAIRFTGGHMYLHDCMQACPTAANADTYAATVRNGARLRAVSQTATRLHTLADTATLDTVDHALAEAMATIDEATTRLGPTHATVVHIPNIDDILAGEDDDTYDWVIPGLIEHQERIILTAEEGAGKSTLLRQFAITAASGIHPFTGEAFDPIRVLHIDVENSLRQSRRRYRPLRIQAGELLNPDNLRVELRVAGLDLTTTEDRDWLLKTTASVQPDLLLIGPIYKLANGDPTEETSAKPVAMILDQVRDTTDCALIVEAHVAKAPSGQRKRPHEPYGWSGWLRWPEIGIFMDKDGTLTPWRGAREERDWPDKLERGGHWPWSPGLTKFDENWITIQKARSRAGRPVTQRELEDLTGLSKGTIHRLIGPGGKYAHGWPGYNAANYSGDTR